MTRRWAVRLAALAVALVPLPAGADHAPVAAPGASGCPGLAWLAWQGARADSAEFHASHVLGHADGSWARFRAVVAWSLPLPCELLLSFDARERTAFAEAQGFDAARFLGAEGCAAALAAEGHTSDGAPDRRWMRFTLGPGAGPCTVLVEAHLASTSEDGVPGASYFEGCTLQATAQSNGLDVTRCLEVLGAHGHEHCVGPAATAIALPQGNQVSWTGQDFAIAYTVYRAGATGSFERHATQAPTRTELVDPAVVKGATYRYEVTATSEPATEGDACGIAEVTAIPDFPTPVAAGLALLGAVALAARRR